VAGKVAEVVSGQTLDKFLDESLFRPLGMVDTGFSVPIGKRSRLATLYGNNETADLLGKKRDHEPSQPFELFPLDSSLHSQTSAWDEGHHCMVHAGGGFMGHYCGGLVSTLNDLARLFLMLSCGGQLPGGKRILQAETVKKMVGEDWLSGPHCLGKMQQNTGQGGVTASGPFGWNALGELGVVADRRQLSEGAFEFEEYGYGSMAEVFWSINPRRDLILIWCTQQVDNHSFSHNSIASLWNAARKAVDRLDSSACSKKPAGQVPGNGRQSLSKKPAGRICANGDKRKADLATSSSGRRLRKKTTK